VVLTRRRQLRDALSKPVKSPHCRGTRIFEPLVSIERE
jgi:hypothetical protein